MKINLKGNKGVSISVVIFLIVIILILACVIVYLLRNSQLTFVEKKVSDNVIQASASTFLTTTKEEISKELYQKLSDANWVKENLYVKQDGSNKSIDSNFKQELMFTVMSDSENDYPIIIVKTEVEEALAQELFAIKYLNEKITVESLTNGAVHNSHNIFVASDTKVAVEYGHMGYWKYSLYKFNSGNKALLDEKEGEMLNPEEGYVELQNLEKEYNLKAIETKLTDENLKIELNLDEGKKSIKTYSYKEMKGKYTGTVKDSTSDGPELAAELYLNDDGTFCFEYAVDAAAGFFGNYIINNDEIMLNTLFTHGSDAGLHFANSQVKLKINSDGTITSLSEGDTETFTRVSRDLDYTVVKQLQTAITGNYLFD